MSEQSDPSILAEFFYKIGWDAKEFEKGAKGIEQSAKAFEANFERMGEKIRGFASEAFSSFATPVLSFFAADKIVDSAKEVGEFAMEMSKLSQSTGESMRDIVAWSDSVAATGGSSKDFQSTLEKLNEQLNDVRIGGSSEFVSYLRLLNISFLDSQHRMKGVLEILPSLSDRFQRLGRLRAIKLGEKMGLDQGTINLLLKGRKEVEKIIKDQVELGSVSVEQAEKARKFYEAWGKIQHLFRTLSLDIAGEILPHMTSMQNSLGGVISFINKNHGLVGNFVKVLGLIGGYKVAKIGLKLLGAEKIGALSAAGKGGIFAGLFLTYTELMDDWDTRQKGSMKNMVTELNNSGHNWMAALLQTAETIALMIGRPFEFFKLWWKQFGAPIQSVGSKIWEKVKAYPGSGKEQNAAINKKLEDSWANFKEKITAGSWGSMHTNNKLYHYFHRNDNIGGAFSAPYNAMSTSKAPVVNINGVYINAENASAEEVGAMFSDKLSDQIKQALSELDDGVKI